GGADPRLPGGGRRRRHPRCGGVRTRRLGRGGSASVLASGVAVARVAASPPGCLADEPGDAAGAVRARAGGARPGAGRRPLPALPGRGAGARAPERAGFVAAEWPAAAGPVAVPVGLRASASSRPAGLRLLPAASVWLWEGPRERPEHLAEVDAG